MNDNDIREKTVSGASWVTAAQGINQVVNLGIRLLLTSYLTPLDFGLVGMVTVFSGFVSIFSELGVGAAIVQKKEVSNTDLSSAFWVNVIAGTVMMVFLMLAAPSIAAFYNEPRLISITRAISLTFLIGAIQVVHFAILLRSFDFKSIAIIEMVSFTFSGLFAVTLALLNFGVWSLVAQSLLTVTIRSTMAFSFSKWRPAVYISWPAIKNLSKFSLNLTGANVTNYWVRNADNLLIGKFLGSTDLGIYSRAYSLMILPLSQISRIVSRVMFPAFCTLQDDIPRMRRIYLKALAVIALITFPITLGLMVVADVFVLGLLGDHWADAIPIIRILCLLGMFQSVGTVAGVIYQARDRTDLQFKWTIYSGIVTISSFLIGLNWGITGVATSYVTASLTLLMYPGTKIVCDLVDLPIGVYVKNLAGIALCAVSMAIVVVILGFYIKPYLGPTTSLIVLACSGATTYLILIVVFRVKAFDDCRSIISSRFAKKTTLQT